MENVASCEMVNSVFGKEQKREGCVGQGDPLSPYLFVMGMEVLDVLIRRVVEGGYLSGCIIRGGSRPSLNISHLFFADDTIVFCEARYLSKKK